MIGKSYRDLLIECGYSDDMLKGMSDVDCEAEYIEISISGGW